MTNIQKFQQLRQREKKRAQTKVALLNALLRRLDERDLTSIKIKDLARDAGVSEPTFFNYFVSKEHILEYFIEVWSVEVSLIAKNFASDDPVQAIQTLFVKSAEAIAAHPQVMLEIIAHRTRSLGLPKHTLSDAEKWLLFPNEEGVEKIEGGGINAVLPPLIEQAVTQGALTCEGRKLFLHLSALFFGAALLVLPQTPSAYPGALQALVEETLKGCA